MNIIKDLMEKCRLSVQYIMEAKAKHAEHANKAAQSLLELLAQEVAFYKKKLN